ncbi:uncharacterized protein JCM15063_002974 [Sporobolomyces koalae]|uniref:uncharacterized protein n=1 Tax=Sporobolomyces koalae TaxID=500713 RepID=UPI00317D3344
MPPRARTRVKKQGKARMVQDDSNYACQDSDDEASVPKPKKRQKGSKAPTKKKANKLEAFASMPLDILCLIMEQMNPKTLLAMSRTCSIFRSILHSPRGQTVWKCAREQIGLNALQRPDVPEWEFASLLFESGCVVCGNKRASFPNYVYFVRACGPCMRANSKDIKPSDAYHSRAFSVVPWQQYYGVKFWWKPMLARATIQLDNLEDDSQALESFLASRDTIQQQAQADAKMIQGWVDQSKEDEKHAKVLRRIIRQDQIIAKLMAEGYEEQEARGHTIVCHPDVNNSRTLTDNVWKRIKPILTRILDTERSERLEKEAIERMERRKLALKPYYTDMASITGKSTLSRCYPPFKDFLDLPSVVALHEPDDDGVPMAQRFSNAESTVLQDMQKYAQELEATVLGNLLVAYRTLDPAFEAQGQLLLVKCTSAMTCPRYSYCKTIGTFPAILDHYRRCAGAEASISGDSFTTLPTRIQAIRQILAAVNASSPSAQQLSDASSTTDLLKLGGNFKCVTCRGKLSSIGLKWDRAYGIGGINWTAMLSHMMKTHKISIPVIRYTLPSAPMLDSTRHKPKKREKEAE